MVHLALTNTHCKSIQRALVASDEPCADVVYDLIETALTSHARTHVLGHDTAAVPTRDNHPDERARYITPTYPYLASGPSR